MFYNDTYDTIRFGCCVFNFLFLVFDSFCSDADHNLVDDGNIVDDVKNESIKNLLPVTPHSEKHDEFRLNFTRTEFYAYFNHAWNDVYWLAHAIIWMGFIGVLAQHHANLHMEMIGARMRIASCSLIYRKVFKIFSCFIKKQLIH